MDPDTARFSLSAPGIVMATAENSPAMMIATFVQAASAVAMVVLTWALARLTKAHVRESRRMTDVMARDFELRVSPLLEFEAGAMRSVTGWESATVPIIIRNLGSYAAVIEGASLEFGPGDSMVSAESPRTVVAVEPGTPREIKLHMPLSKIPEAERSGPNAGGRVRFRLRYTVRSVTGALVPGISREFRL